MAKWWPVLCKRLLALVFLGEGIARQTLRLKLRDLGLSIARHGEAEDDDAV